MEWKRIFYHPLTAFFITFLVVLVLFSLASTRRKNQEQFEAFQKREALLENQKNEKDLLQLQKAEVNDPFYQEKVLRDELLLQQPGEKIIQLPEIKLEEPTPTPTQTPATPWQEWRELLF